MAILLSLLPIAVILVLLLIWRKPADVTGVIGLVAVALVALLFFSTSLEVVARSTVAGLVKSFSVSLIVATSLLQMALMQSTGALKRIIVFIKSISNENRAIQIMMVNIGFGTLMVAVGATPVSILPPILIAMGYSTFTAIALPAIGYDALCTYALLGAPVVVFVDTINKFFETDIKSGLMQAFSLSDVGSIFWLFLPIVSTLIGFCMLWIVDKWQGVKKGFLPCITTGLVISVVSYFTNKVDNLVPLTGVICGAAVILTMVIYLKVTGKQVFNRSNLTKEDIECEKQMPLWKAFTPWGILILLILAINLYQPLFNTLYRDVFWTFPIKGLAADGSAIPTRWLWNAYTWIFVSTILSMIFLRPSKKQITETIKLWGKRAPRPVLAAAIFFAIGEIMGMAGFDMVSKKFATPSMIKVLADGSAQLFKGSYSFVSPVIGLFGGFITGSEASTIGMFGKYALITTKTLGLSASAMILVTAALAFGGGLASVISPAKLQNAAASIDKIGEENKVIRTAFVFSIILTAVTALFAGLYIILGVVK